MKSALQALTSLLIKAYQKYSATRPARCKFYPSCSNYAATAISRYGFKGLFMSASRLLRCHPWSHGGVDYVDAELDSTEARNKKLNSGLITGLQREGAH
jgi:putative membrane protein insertion efficiency factor